MRHGPADVVGVHAEYDVPDDQVAELKDEQKDRWDPGTFEQPHNQVVHEDADGPVDQRVDSDSP